MKYELIITGDQAGSVASLAHLVAEAADRSSLFVRRSEVVSRRGSAYEAHVRIAGEPIYCATVPDGSADLVLALSPREALACLPSLRGEGSVVTNTQPSRESLLDVIRSLARATLVDASWLAEEIGSGDLVLFVMLGAVANRLPLPEEELLAVIQEVRNPKALEAFQAGQAAVHAEHLLDEFATV